MVFINKIMERIDQRNCGVGRFLVKEFSIHHIISMLTIPSKSISKLFEK